MGKYLSGGFFSQLASWGHFGYVFCVEGTTSLSDFCEVF